MAARRAWVEIGVGLLGGLLGACLAGTGHPIDTCRIKMRQLRGDLEIYAAKHKGRYPAALDEVAEQPVDRLDVWGTPFVYSLRPDGRAYVLRSLGADRSPDGEGEGADLVDWGGRDSSPAPATSPAPNASAALDLLAATLTAQGVCIDEVRASSRVGFYDELRSGAPVMGSAILEPPYQSDAEAREAVVTGVLDPLIAEAKGTLPRCESGDARAQRTMLMGFITDAPDLVVGQARARLFWPGDLSRGLLCDATADVGADPRQALADALVRLDSRLRWCAPATPGP